MNLRLINSVLTSALTALMVFVLLSSFGLHAVQISHMHPGHQGHHESGHQNEQDAHGEIVLGEYMHTAEKKLFLLVLSILLLGSIFLQTSWAKFLFITNLLFDLLLRKIKELAFIIKNYLNLLLSQGILNPKLH
jgi:hypothetical protein